MSRVKKFKAQKRHIAKAISWRFFGTLGTLAIGWFVTGDASLGTGIALVELITKTILYYFHERVWFNIDFPNSQRRHLIKTLTWRIVGTVDTMIIGWALTGDAKVGLAIGGIEAVVKMLMYYLHERAWHETKYGLEPVRNNNE